MKIGIRKKINVILFVSMFAVGLSIGISFYIQYSNYMMQSVVDKLYNGLFSIYNIIDVSELQKYTPETRYEDSYITSWKKVKSIQKNLNLAYIYVLRLNEKGELIFLMDTGTHPDPNQKTDSDEDDNLFTIYKDAPKEAMESIKTGKLVVVPKEYTDKWGTFKSAFYPIKYKDKTIGVIGSDYKINDILELQKKAKLILFTILMIGVIVIIIAGTIIRRIIVVPIQKLNVGSSQIANGNLEYSIQIHQKDEIGELASSFNLMAKNLKESFNTIQEYNEQLEEKVTKRTEELQETLGKVQELKTQQDGDYFLTTLITNPLMQNRNKSASVKVEFFLEQKKKFQFKGKTHALGGDINVSGNLNFNGLRHTVFFNGDAMGKSMQGAGGALVIGSVFNSIMARSASNKKILTISPETWIKEAFVEIQRVMESFDGAMLVSCILGIIEDTTGRLLFFNAEHPFSVLYRDGKASFIETEISAHKMGMPFNTDVNVYRFQLQPGDILICGSDGKDDLVLTKNAEFGRVINEDENLFLRLVEEGSGSIKKIYDNIILNGEISDDLSLLRISFMEETNREPIEELNQKQKPNYDIVMELIKEKKFSHALEELEKNPDELNLIYLYRKAYCLNKLKRNYEALKLFDQADEKLKEHTKVLKLLAKLYFDMGNFTEAENYLEKLLQIKPNDEDVKNSLLRIRSLKN